MFSSRSTAFANLEDLNNELLTSNDILITPTLEDSTALITPKQVSVKSPDAPWQMHYGELGAVKGVVTFVTTDEGEDGGQYLHVIYTYAAHEVDRIEAVYFDDVLFTHSENPSNVFYPNKSAWGNGDWTNLAFVSADSLGSTTQAANTHAVSQSDILFPGKWTTNHKQSGRAHLYCIFKYDETMFPNGLPEIKIKLRGKKIFDPREVSHDKADPSTWEYSNNAVLCAADFLTENIFGFGMQVSYDNAIDETNLIAAANICDETVTLKSGSESRYTVNGSFLSTATNKEILQAFSNAIGGPIARIGGKWHFFPATYRTPSITLTEDDIISDVEISLLNSKSQTFNAVKGLFSGSENNWEPSDYPAITNSTYQVEDGVQLWRNHNLPLVSSSSQCQRLAKILLEDSRQSILVSFTAKLSAYRLQSEDNIYLTLSKYGWSSKVFRVINTKLVLTNNAGAPTIVVAVTLKETASGIYDWANGEETTVDLAPNTSLPSPTDVYPPTAITLNSGTNYLVSQGDGTILSAINVAWTAPVNPISAGGSVEVQYKKSVDSSWMHWASIPSGQTFTNIIGVEDGVNYDVRVRTVTPLNQKSAWVNTLFHNVIGKTAPPETVTGFIASVGSYNIALSWAAVSDKDLKHYVLQLDTLEVLTITNSTSYFWDIQAAGTYNFEVYAVDTSGNVSAAVTTASVTIAAPSTPVATHSIVGETVVLSWDEVEPLFNGFAIDKYIIKYGSTYGSATQIATSKATKYTLKVDWTGDRTFWVEAVDVYGNNGSASEIEVVITPPSQVPSITPTVIDNTVLLRWTAPSAGSLPISTYRVYKGAVFATATLIGEIKGTFHTVIETVKGIYTYWIVAVDTAGNEATEKSSTQFVNQPPDYVLRSNQTLDFGFGDTRSCLVGVADTTMDDFSPLTDHNITLWLKADAGITSDANGLISTWADQSGNGNDVTQSTDTNKPLISRSDSSENWITYSEEFTNADWSGSLGCTRADNTTSGPDATFTAGTITATATTARHGLVQSFSIDKPVAGKKYRISTYVKNNNHQYLWIGEGGDAHWHGGYFDFTAGTFTENSYLDYSEVVDIGNGWYRVILEWTRENDAGAHVYYCVVQNGATSASPQSFTASGTEAFYVTGVQMSSYEADTNYIKTESTFAYKGNNNKPVVVFDGVDNYLTSSIPWSDLITNTDFSIFVVLDVMNNTTNSATLWNNDPIIHDSTGEYVGLFLKSSNSGITGSVVGHNYDGSSDQVSASYVGRQTAIVTFRHIGGNVQMELDGAQSTTSATGNTSNLTNTIQIAGDSVSAIYSGIKICEIIVSNAALTDVQCQEIEDYLNWRWQPKQSRYTEQLPTQEFYAPVKAGQTFEQRFKDIFQYGPYDHSANLVLWLDASDPDSFKLDEGGDIITWYDKSQNKFNFSQSTEARRPSVTTINSRQAVLFSKSGNTYLDMAYNSSLDVANAGDFTIFAVVKVPAIDATTEYGILDVNAVDDTKGWYLRLDGDTLKERIRTNQASANTQIVASTAPTATDVNVICFTSSSTSGDIRRNDTSVGTGTVTASVASDGTILLGKQGSTNFNDAICELIVFDTALTSGQITQINDVLVDKWTNASYAATMQNAIDWGYDSGLLPGAVHGETEYIIDFGTTLPGTLVNTTWQNTTVAGSACTVTPTISYSSDNITYTDGTAGSSQVFASNFRYVKLALVIDAPNDKSACKISDLQVRLDVKETSETISGTCNSGDSGGTTFNFAKTWIDVNDISVQVLGTTFGVPVVDFTDVPNPTSFKVLIFDADGTTRLTKNVLISVAGVESSA